MSRRWQTFVYCVPNSDQFLVGQARPSFWRTLIPALSPNAAHHQSSESAAIQVVISKGTGARRRGGGGGADPRIRSVEVREKGAVQSRKWVGCKRRAFNAHRAPRAFKGVKKKIFRARIASAPWHFPSL